MKIKAKAFTRYPVTIVDIYDDHGDLWAICVAENGAIEQYKVDDVKIIDKEYLPKEEKEQNEEIHNGCNG